MILSSSPSQTTRAFCAPDAALRNISVDAAQIITTREHLFFRFHSCNLSDQLFRQLHLVCAGLHIRAIKTLDVSLIKDGLHRLDLLEWRFQLLQEIFLEYASVQGGFVG